MSTTHISSNNRASLLAGLRTGGVRSSSVPHTAASPSFNIPFPQTFPTYSLSEEDEDDQLLEIPQRHVYNPRSFPVTAAVDGPGNRFVSQQAVPLGLNPLSMPFTSAHAMSNRQIQLQMMQIEMMKLQVSLLFIFILSI